MTLSVEKVAYKAIFDVIVDSITTPSILEELDEDYLSNWAKNSTYSYDFMDMVFTSNESIL